VRDVLLDSRARQRGVTDARAVQSLLDDHLAGRRQAGEILWSLLNLELWYRTWIDGDGIQQLGGASARPASISTAEGTASFATTA
jgi:hypothetical protein